METELTHDEISQLCAFMRVIDLMKSNQNILDENIEMKQNFEQVCCQVNQIMEILTEAQRDKILDVHNTQLQMIAIAEAKKKAKKRKKRV